MSVYGSILIKVETGRSPPQTHTHPPCHTHTFQFLVSVFAMPRCRNPSEWLQQRGGLAASLATLRPADRLCRPRAAGPTLALSRDTTIIPQLHGGEGLWVPTGPRCGSCREREQTCVEDGKKVHPPQG